MTIHVVTPEHGRVSFDADNWNTIDPDGSGELWIGHEETGVGVAHFAKGAWSYVYETLDEDPEPAPETAPEPTIRQWDSLQFVPHNVRVTDVYGVLWTHPWDRWESVRSFGHLIVKPLSESYEHYGPFTEVLDK